MSDLFVGQTVRVSAIEHVNEDGSRYRYKMPKGRALVLLVMGEEPAKPMVDEDYCQPCEVIQKLFPFVGSGQDLPADVALPVGAELTSVTARVRL